MYIYAKHQTGGYDDAFIVIHTILPARLLFRVARWFLLFIFGRL